MTFCLTLLEHNGRIVTTVFDKDVVMIGRSSSNDVRPDPVLYSQVSRNHGRVVRRGPGEFVYEDLKSTQGSYCDGREIPGAVTLHRDDVVVLGKDGPSISITWPKERITGQMGTHYRIIERPSPAFPLAFSAGFPEAYVSYEKIGAGGFGEVWRAVPRDGAPAMAIKLLHPMLMNPDNLAEEDRAALITRFAREARVTWELSQSGAPGIVKVHAWGDDPDRDYLFLIMDFIEGVPLDRMIRRHERMTWQQIATYFSQVAYALDAAHNFEFKDETGKVMRGVIHRDVKPGNILVEPEKGTAWLVDFGVAGFLEGGERLTCTNVAVGTHLYLPPEALVSHVVAPSTDLWGFTMTLYLALSGAHFPYPANEAGMGRLLPDDYTPIEMYHSSIPPELAQAVRRGLALNREDRIQTAREWGDLLGWLAQRG